MPREKFANPRDQGIVEVGLHQFPIERLFGGAMGENFSVAEITAEKFPDEFVIPLAVHLLPHGFCHRDTKAAIVGGVDATQDALASMKAGDLKVTVFQDAAGQGKGAVDAALALAAGKPVEKKVYIPFQLVTPANMDQFMKKN